MSTDYGRKYAPARERVLATMKMDYWISWRVLRGICHGYAARLRELKRLGYKFTYIADPSGHGKRYHLVNPIPTEPEGKAVKVYLSEADAEALVNLRLTRTAQDAVDRALQIFRANRHKL